MQTTKYNMTILSRFLGVLKVYYLVKDRKKLKSDLFLFIYWNLVLQLSEKFFYSPKTFLSSVKKKTDAGASSGINEIHG